MKKGKGSPAGTNCQYNPRSKVVKNSAVVVYPKRGKKCAAGFRGNQKGAGNGLCLRKTTRLKAA